MYSSVHVCDVSDHTCYQLAIWFKYLQVKEEIETNENVLVCELWSRMALAAEKRHWLLMSTYNTFA